MMITQFYDSDMVTFFLKSFRKEKFGKMQFLEDFVFFRDDFFDSEEMKLANRRRGGTISTDRICVTKGDIRRAMGKCKAKLSKVLITKKTGILADTVQSA